MPTYINHSITIDIQIDERRLILDDWMDRSRMFRGASRNLSPKTRGAGGALISPSPLSFSSRQPPVPRSGLGDWTGGVHLNGGYHGIPQLMLIL